MSDHIEDQPLTLHLRPDVRARLDAEADVSHQPAAEIATAAIENYIESQNEKRAQLVNAMAAAEEGVFISGEKMAAWISSWGTENELPEPEPDIILEPRQSRSPQ